MGGEARSALLMFHTDWDVCRSRVRLLRAFNPGVPVHGLYGGDPEQYAAARDEVGPFLDSLSACDLEDGRWRWQHTDLVIRHWYQATGHAFAFDVLHVVQWDLLLFDSLTALYGHVPRGAVALTGITPLERIADTWHWTRVEPNRTESAELLRLARHSYAFRGVPKACLGPGVALPRAFLDRYAVVDVPQLGHDELRFPLFAELFGHALVDTGFYPQWFDPDAERLFNANGTELPLAEVREELVRPGGRRTFHPCRESFTDEVVTHMISLVARDRGAGVPTDRTP
jgi:hypothetical protein